MGQCAKSCATAFIGHTPHHTHTVFLYVLHICVYGPNCLIPLSGAAEALIGPSEKKALPRPPIAASLDELMDISAVSV